MAGETTRSLIERFWQTMNTNDWRAASQLLHEEYVLEYPQSGERMHGRESFIAVNAHYPAAGPWGFHIERVIASGSEAVSDVIVTAPSVRARVVSFFELREDTIWRMTEFWPDPFEAAAWRAQWTEQSETEPDQP